MALRARLVAPPPRAREAWPWHTLNYGSVSSSIMFVRDRRMEAETYLSSGFGLRAAIEGKRSSWVRLADVAKVWMPGRLKGIQVSRDSGTPFLAATQVYDVRPIPRKWLALARTSDAERRFVRPGMVLVTCSGSVGRSTLAYTPHENTLISHDLLRVQAIDEKDRGWIYAYLQAPQVRAMATGAKYGHIIKHLETSHLEALPIPTVDDATSADFLRRVGRILTLRNEGHRLLLEAEARFEMALGPLKVTDWGEEGFSVKASRTILRGRLRFDASVHNPGVAAIRRHLANHGEGFSTVAEAGYEVWLPTRFRRVPAADGVPLVESAALFEVNPEIDKRIADIDFGDLHRGRVQPGWLLLARSGQVYGINGTAILATQALANHVISDHVIRVAPRADSLLRVGYLLVALSHPLLGRPLVKSLAYGSSVPHIDPADFRDLEIVRLKPAEESAIADLAEASAKARAEADLLERTIAQDAGEILERFIAGS
jgi:hypothetical protein